MGTPAPRNNIRQLAKARGLSLREVGRRAGLTWRGFKLIYLGRVLQPREASERAIVEALGFSLYPKNIKAVFPNSVYVSETVKPAPEIQALVDLAKAEIQAKKDAILVQKDSEIEHENNQDNEIGDNFLISIKKD